MARIIANFDLEKDLLEKGYGLLIGIDEAGRGPLAGPVVAAVACLKNENWDFISEIESSENDKDKWHLVRDSKTLSERQRDMAFDFVRENFHVGIGICDHETIDRMNILEATFLAMKKALTEFSNITKEMSGERILLVDGNKEIPSISMEQKAIVSGDKLVKSIAAASIIAKVTRDRIMLLAEEKYPHYAFKKHKGYGTKLHFELLRKFGPCEIHRKSFDPVKKAINIQDRMLSARGGGY
ncbi:MAG: ribonuclease HII [Candidatus Moranbacteria bacterium]|nr:ribonuclease HII [Candidatus Moranbacteria bacterium]